MRHVIGTLLFFAGPLAFYYGGHAVIAWVYRLRGRPVPKLPPRGVPVLLLAVMWSIVLEPRGFAQPAPGRCGTLTARAGRLCLKALTP
jgi:hypothetical protein